MKRKNNSPSRATRTLNPNHLSYVRGAEAVTIVADIGTEFTASISGAYSRDDSEKYSTR